MMSDSPKILLSIIIPVYNVSHYIERCVRSIKIDDISTEIILIDDGSNDGSSAICDQLSEDIVPVRTIHTENKGVSNARNLGILQSRGDWIIFVDGDDYLASQALTAIESFLNNNVDLILHGWNYVNDSMVTISSCEFKDECLSLEEACKKDVFCGFVWAYAFRRDIIIDNNILFSTNIQYAEDWEFIIKYYSYIRNKIVILPDCLYNQVKRVGSATQQKLGEKYITDNFYMFGSVLRFSKNNTALRKMVIRKLHLLIKWFVNNVIYCSTDKHNLKRVYKREWMIQAHTDISFALHPIVFLPGIANQQIYFFICRIISIFSKK
ncbi:MAG: glycosyltransferase [Alphaproteobacteria bacterium]|nr:glycosyltransferase [Alphaproteobacteria bacterium]